MASSFIKALILIADLNLQGCATSLQTFLTGAVVETSVGVGGIVCVVGCH